MTERKAVIVHVFHEDRGQLAAGILGVAEDYDGGPMVRGEASDEEIAKLCSENLIVEVVEPPPVDLAQADRSLYRATVRYSWQETDAGTLEPRLPDGRVVPVRPRSRSGTFATILKSGGVNLSEIITDAGGAVTRALPGGVMITRLGTDARIALDLDPRVDVEAFNRSATLAPGFELGVGEIESVIPSSGEEREFDLIAHAPERVAEIEAWVGRKGDALVRVGASATKVRIRIDDTSALLDEAALLDSVFDVAPVPVARFCLDRLPPLVGLAPRPQFSPTNLLDGSGQIVGMTDGAVCASHGDLVGRVTLMSGTATPVSAHGTHVAGIIAGNGACSGGRIMGIAPAAQLVVEALAVGPRGELTLPLDMAQSLAASYAAGARIHNLSFAEDHPQSLYSQRASELDAFAVEHPDMLIVVAAGNGATTEANQWRADGEVDMLSVASPGIAKNVLTVGACCSDRPAGGHIATTWAQFPPVPRYASPPTAGAPLSGDAADISAFSGRGWGHGAGRIKPDLVAPGTNIVAARASPSTDMLWGEHSADYLYSGGTSMAAPIVAGCAALVRQYYCAIDPRGPSAALLRATLIAGTDWLNGRGATNIVPAPPNAPAALCANVDQGFGRVNVAKALALDGAPRKLCFVDVPANRDPMGTVSNGLPGPFEQDNDRRRFWFECDGDPAPIDIALCFTDPMPGPTGTILGLFVQPVGDKPRAGNDCALKTAYPLRSPTPDRDNNVQLIRMGPTQGVVEILITALALPRKPVGFALVVLGNVKDGELTRY